MARLSIATVEEHLGNQQGDFKYTQTFKLSDDGDTARIRFLFDSPTEAEFHSVHTVRMTSKNGKDYGVDVDCLADGKHECPFCREAQKYKNDKFPLVSTARDAVFMPLVNIYNDKKELEPVYQVWKRSTRFFKDTLSSYAARYSPLSKKVCEVERKGKRGDTKLTYNLYPCDSDYDANPYDELKPIAELKKDLEVKGDDIFGRADSLVKNWNEDDMQEFLQTGTYPKANKATEDKEEEAEEAPKARTRSSNRGF